MSGSKSGKKRSTISLAHTASVIYATSIGTSTSTWYEQDLQATISFSNPAWLAYKRSGARRRGQMDLGSNFFTIHDQVEPGYVSLEANNGYLPSAGSYRGVKGDFLPFNATVTGGFSIPYDKYDMLNGGLSLPAKTDALDPYGATAISRCAPTNPNAGLAVTLAELKREGLPSLASATLKSRGTGRINGAASDHLNMQFGVLPLVSDIRDTISAVRNRGRILEQYARDSGRPVRRTYRFPEFVSRTTGPLTSTAPWPGGTEFFPIVGTQTYEHTRRIDRWFVGSFVYHRVGADNKWKALLQRYQDLNHLVGTGVGPGTIWNLLPWSWAVDWFTNVGDVMNNAQMFMNDGLIMDYGYVMEKESLSYTYRRVGCKATSWVDPTGLRIPPVWMCSKTTVSKERRQANPFGFGVTNSSLSARQWSIAAALGISRTSHIP